MAVSTPSFRCLAMAIMIINAGIFMMISGNHSNVSAAKFHCGKGVGDQVSKCSVYVMKSGPKVKPSRACRSAVNSMNVPCICSLVNKEIEKATNMAKVVFVADCCGKTLASGTKCGSYRVSAA